ncbi:MAG: TetR/AcrR family transcriptional regulator [Cyanobacteria bacterium CRU_2_1]|nr:TetR/AcrR family transcriptional regulator [Cyanobacteria bacterium RU_5_0]NJR60805.1 TetR/AcrR family transcriptional regulator [Cyanobacteria bacterium CRU_2_1]
MSKSAKSLTGRPRSIEADQAILQAALELLAEVGYQTMSIEAIASRAGVGKATIYRRYTSKEELVADALASAREKPIIPNTGSFKEDIGFMLEQAAKTFDTVGRQTLALTISSASSSPQFAQIYWTKYMQPRRKAFAEIFERAKARGEIRSDLDTELTLDLMMGSVLYAVVFRSDTPIEPHIRRVMSYLFADTDRCDDSATEG